MVNLFLYSTSEGCYVFNQNFFVIDKVLLKKDNIVENSKLIEQGRFTETEKSLIKKHAKKSEITIIGFKTEKLENAKVVWDLSKFERISDALKKDGILERLRAADTLVARAAVKGSVNEDLFIVQATNNIVELERIANTMAKRLREWFSYYVPEFSESIQDHKKFAELIVKKSKDELLKEIGLKKEQSMGADLKKNDIEPMIELAKNLINTYNLKEKQEDYLKKLMESYAPNINAVAGTLIGAKLLAKTGSLKKLSEFPSSTVQILGAEEAFFRHIKTGARMPKYGYIHEHPLINKVDKKNQGKAARAIADKISIAAKVDYFKGKFVGDSLKKQIYDKFKVKMG